VGLIHLDAGVLIGFLDGSDVHHEAARDVFAGALQAGEQLAMAASAFAEILLGPARRGAADIRTVRNLADRLPIEIIPLDVEIATTAARLRAAHRTLRLPDALVIATAIEAAADRLLTTDRKWPTARTLGLKATLTHL
jgi:predicted nucleic acid-binding protein